MMPSQRQQNQRGSRWKNKRYGKKGAEQKGSEQKEEEPPAKADTTSGIDTLMKRVVSLPVPLLTSLSIFGKLGKHSLLGSLNVVCKAEAILVKGRYLKLSREVSQTPWALNEDDDENQDQSKPPAKHIKSV